MSVHQLCISEALHEVVVAEGATYGALQANGRQCSVRMSLQCCCSIDVYARLTRQNSISQGFILKDNKISAKTKKAIQGKFMTPFNFRVSVEV